MRDALGLDFQKAIEADLIAIQTKESQIINLGFFMRRIMTSAEILETSALLPLESDVYCPSHPLPQR